MNTLKTGIFLGLLTGLLVLMGGYFGGSHGAVTFFIIAMAMNFFSYWFSDKIVLAMYRAQPVSESDAPQLYSIIRELTERAGLPMPKVYILPQSTPNAFATGRNPNHSAVAVTSGIMELLSKDELKGVIAHELSHIKNRDILISTIAATIAGAITLIASMLRYSAIFFGSRDRDNDSGGIIGLIALSILAPIAAMIIQLAVSRAREYQADESGAYLAGSPMGLASALEKLERSVQRYPMEGGAQATAHMFIVNPFRKEFFGNLFRTHPSTKDRIERLYRMR